MEADYLDTGRANQKWRTRQALLEAAQTLLRQGRTPTVTDVADAARVARTTAYRYFPTQELLLAGSSVFATLGTVSSGPDSVAAGPGSPAERLDAVVRSDWKHTSENENAFRLYLASSLGEGADHRPANRIRWLKTALDPLRTELDKKGFARLIAALSLCVGTESFVVLKDVCRLSAEDAEEVKRWAAQVLLQAALEAVDSGRPSGGKRARRTTAAAGQRGKHKERNP